MDKLEKRIGMPIITLFLLALLGIPRVIAHDLKWIEEGTVVNSLFVFIPPIIWIIVVLFKTNRPFKPLFWLGLIYGILLGVTHQVLWSVVFDVPPTLGGNLENLSPIVSTILMRFFAMLSSISTGAIIGLILGIVGVIINLFRQKR